MASCSCCRSSFQLRVHLLTVVTCLRHEACNDEHAVRVNRRLCVVALVKARAGLPDATAHRSG